MIRTYLSENTGVIFFWVLMILRAITCIYGL